MECSTDNLHELATFAESYEPRPGGGVSLASRRLRCLVTDSLDRTNAGSRDGIVHPCGGEIARDKIEAKLSDPTALCGQVGSPNPQRPIELRRLVHTNVWGPQNQRTTRAYQRTIKKYAAHG